VPFRFGADVPWQIHSTAFCPRHPERSAHSARSRTDLGQNSAQDDATALLSRGNVRLFPYGKRGGTKARKKGNEE
jgi:hypothetical protein